MSKDGTETSDSELKAYLEGRDGISATYRQTREETPSPALDALIVEAARAAVRPTAGVSARRWGKYRLAASFMVGVLVTALYLDQPEPFEAAQQLAGSAPTPAGAPAVSTALKAAEPPDAATEGTTSAVADVLLPVPLVTRLNEVPAPDSARAEIQLSSSSGLRSRTAVRQEARAPAGELQEFAVSRASVRADASELSYRATQDAWLAEIARLSGEVTVLGGEFEAASLRLDEETARFLEAFPDASLEDVIAAPPESADGTE